MRSDIIDVQGVAFFGPIAHRISIYPAIKRMLLRGHYDALILRSQQVHSYMEYCFTVAGTGVNAVPCTLVHGIADVGPGGFFQEIQLADDPMVLPGCTVFG